MKAKFLPFFFFIALFQQQLVFAEGKNDLRYVYQSGDTPELIQKSMLKPSKSWGDIAQYNNFDSNRVPEAGSLLRIPHKWLRAENRTAQAMSVDGKVFVKRNRQTRMTPLKANVPLMPGDEVLTRKGSALLKMPDGSIVRLEPETSLVLNKLSQKASSTQNDTEMRLNKGGVMGKIPKMTQGSEFKITTPSAVAAIRGTNFRLRTDPEGSKLEVLNGEVEFSHDHGDLSVGSGTGAIIKKQDAHINQKDLYEAPKRAFGAIEALHDMPIKLLWSEVPGADYYQFELKAITANLEEDIFAELDAPQITLDDLSAGSYQVSLSAVDKNGLRGYEDISQITVQGHNDVPQLLLPENSASVDSTALEFSWTVSEPSTLTKLEVAKDPSFTNLVSRKALDKNRITRWKANVDPGVYYWRVKSLSKQLNDSESEVRQLTLTQPLDSAIVYSVDYQGTKADIRWKDVENANGYILQVSKTEDFEEIVRQETVTRTNASVQMDAGNTYFVRIKPVADGFYTSKYGPSRTLYIAP